MATIDLDDKIWQQVNGGYKMLYDVSIPLRQLAQTDDPKEIDQIFQELWDELHHQGDVELASYLAVPQLVRIGIKKGLFDSNILGLCTLIDIQRHELSNPDLPPEHQDYYNEGLADLKQFILRNIDNEMDDTTYTMALSSLAVCTGRIKLGKAIMRLEDESVLDEFLEQY